MGSRACSVVTENVQPLTTNEIDRRISLLVAEVAEGEYGAAALGAEGDVMRPRPISAAELVRRMRPFIVLN